jgi:hypothetical protein
MKLLLKFIGIILLAFIAISSCKKTMTDAQYDKDQNFGTKAVKEWYYNIFLKMDESKNLIEQGQKYPDWKYGESIKMKDMEIVEFPLLKAKNGFSIPSGKMSPDEIKKVYKASLKRIVFIKIKGEIHVREINYIPSFEYARKNNFDISKIKITNKDNDFEGRMIVKNWKGEILKTHFVFNGKFSKTLEPNYKKELSIKGNGSSTSSLDDCMQTVCMWYVDCLQYPDGLIISCGEPYMDPNDCHEEPIPGCTPDDDDESGCGANPTPECICAIYGTGCPDPDPEEGEVVSVQKTFTIHHENGGGGSDVWDLRAYAQLQGVRFVNPNMNTFTSITANQNPDIECQSQNGQCLFANPYSPAYGLFHSLASTNNLLNSNKNAHSNQTVVLYYPNTGQYRSLSNYYTWYANTDLQ